MKRIDTLVYRPHSKAEACQWDARPDHDGREGFGEGAEVSVVRRADLDSLIAGASDTANPIVKCANELRDGAIFQRDYLIRWRAWAQERMALMDDSVSQELADFDAANPEPRLPHDLR